MSRPSVARLSSLVRELRAKRTAAASVPLAVEALQAAGFHVCGSWEGGLSVDAAPGLDAALDRLEANGVKPGLVVVIRNLGAEATP